ncbi:MAG: alpha/beta hydrolase [Planctomycetota bacterium]|nr:alpha/beta hydrolase [Planctomycetota bacterium]
MRLPCVGDNRLATSNPPLNNPGDLSVGGTPAAATNPWSRRLMRTLKFVVVIYLAVVLLMWLFENSLVYHPSPLKSDVVLPAGFENAEFTSADGTELHGWYLPNPDPQAVVLFCHGNGGNISHRVSQAIVLNRLGASVLLFDYRGYGRSAGSPNEAGILDDSRAAREWLATKAGIPEDQIVLLGESLGSGVAVDLAMDGARGVILQNAFASLPDAASAHFPWIPVKWLMRNRYDSLAKIKNYHGPLLQSHGNHDRIVPFASGQKLFAAANEPKQFVTIAGGDHNDMPSKQWYDAIGQFFARLEP